MEPPTSTLPDELVSLLRTVRRRLRQLTVAVVVAIFALFLTAAAVFGSLVNYFSLDPMLFGGVTAGVAILGLAVGWITGFVCGWLGRRR
ncbi:MAG: hypothetical protein ACUVUC_06705 [Thermoguttaceae bacterium]